MRGRASPLVLLCAAIFGLLQAQPGALAQSDAAAPQSVQRGENFSAKPAPALFASDCTGAGCHKGPQGLGKRFGLAAFLREHYTNSRESAAALANYLASIPAPAERSSRQGRETPGGRASRAAARPDDDTPSHRSRRNAEPADALETTPGSNVRGRRSAEPTDRTGRGQRGREATAPSAASSVAPPSAASVSPPEPAAEPVAAPPPAPPPAPQVFDIFD
jgi:hypothetical protein